MDLDSLKKDSYNDVRIAIKKDGLVYDEYGFARINVAVFDGEKEISSLVTLIENPDFECQHTVTERIAEIPATCLENGKTAIVKCSLCGNVSGGEVIPAKGHQYVETVTEATCTTDGYITHTCSVCGNTYTDSTVLALGHSFTNYVSNGNATCTADGTKTAKCDRCDVTNTVTDEGSAKGHTIVIDKASAPTCTETGLTEGKHCAVCNTVLVKQEVIPATGHNDNNSDGICDSCGEDLGTHTPIENCSCNCHKSGFAGFIYKIVRFFWKLFRINKVCACGQAHY